MLDNTITALATLGHTIQENWLFLLTMMGILWGIQIVNSLLHYRLNILGIYPRHPLGLIGIVFSPFLHGSYKHLFFNSIPLIVLATLVLANGRIIFFQITLFIMACSGLAIWLFARRAFHVGASSLIIGYWGFLLFNAYLQQSAMAIILAALCLYYFWSLVFSLFPREEKVSWEGHLFGFFSGLLASYALAHHYFK